MSDAGTGTDAEPGPGSEGTTQSAPAQFWEERYAAADGLWSGRVNRVLADVAAALPPGRALDLGCGEGGDAVWLARHGWRATGIDISPTAVQRAREAARAAGLGSQQAHFIAADLTETPPGEFDLVTASFLHSPVALDRIRILRQAAACVVSGGHLLVTSHLGFPPWAQARDHGDGHAHSFPTPEEELEMLDFDLQEWEVRLVETRTRSALGPNGEAAELEDGVLLLRRR